MEDAKLGKRQLESIFTLIAMMIWFDLDDSENKPKKEGTTVSVNLNNTLAAPYGIPAEIHTGLKTFCQRLGWEILSISQKSVVVLKKMTTIEVSKTALPASP